MKNRYIKQLLTFLSVIMLGQAAWGQTSSDPTQTLCFGTVEPYCVDCAENGGAGSTGSTYTWSVTTAGFLGTIAGNPSNNISIDWGNTPAGTYTLQVLETNQSCQGTLTTLTVIIQPELPSLFTQIGPLCQNSVAVELPNVSTNGIAGSWNPLSVNTSTSGTQVFQFTVSPLNAAGQDQCARDTSMTIEITPEVTPTFAAIGPLCQNSAAPALPATSQEGITGTWSPNTITTTADG
ncbi:MAG: hypothetical protein ACK478_02620, partial [Flavobacteriales bacterium]